MKRAIVAVLACAAILGSVGSAAASSSRAAPAAKVNKSASITIDVGNTTALQIAPPVEAKTSELPFGFMQYDRLVYLDNKIELKPMLATKGTFAPDGMSLTVTMRTDAVFHDGSPVTPDAVKQSIQRAKSL